MSKKKDHAEEQAVSAGGARARPRGRPGTPRRTAPVLPSIRVPFPLPAMALRPARQLPPRASMSLKAAWTRPARSRRRSLDLRDKLLRKQADFENFRKRMIRERDEAARYANAALLTDVIATIDDFERAIRSAEESRDFASFLQGVSHDREAAAGDAGGPLGPEAVHRHGRELRPQQARGRAAGGRARPMRSPRWSRTTRRGTTCTSGCCGPARVKVQVPAAQEATKENAPGPGGAGEAPGRTGEAR